MGDPIHNAQVARQKEFNLHVGAVMRGTDAQILAAIKSLARQLDVRAHAVEDFELQQDALDIARMAHGAVGRMEFER